MAPTVSKHKHLCQLRVEDKAKAIVAAGGSAVQPVPQIETVTYGKSTTCGEVVTEKPLEA